MPESMDLRLLVGKRKWFWAVAAAVAGLDQVSKYFLAKPAVSIENQIDILPFLRLVRRPLNVRGAFSLGPHGALFYVIAAGAVLLLIAYLFLSTRPKRVRPLIALGSLCGGATGNLIDRLVLGGVRDFIDLHWMDRAHWPTFNVADTAICIGVLMLVLEGLRPAEEGAPQGAPEKAAGNSP